MKNLVIVIIAVLIGWLAYSQFKGQNKPADSGIVKYAEGLKSSEEKAEEAKDAANLAIIRSAVVQFRGSQGRYPENLDELVSKGFLDRAPRGVSYDKETGEVKY